MQMLLTARSDKYREIKRPTQDPPAPNSLCARALFAWTAPERFGGRRSAPGRMTHSTRLGRLPAYLSSQGPRHHSNAGPHQCVPLQPFIAPVPSSAPQAPPPSEPWPRRAAVDRRPRLCHQSRGTRSDSAFRLEGRRLRRGRPIPASPQPFGYAFDPFQTGQQPRRSLACCTLSSAPQRIPGKERNLIAQAVRFGRVFRSHRSHRGKLDPFDEG